MGRSKLHSGFGFVPVRACSDREVFSPAYRITALKMAPDRFIWQSWYCTKKLSTKLANKKTY